MAIDFKNTVFLGVAGRLDQCLPPDKPEIILSGRSNVGKSSLINALAGNRQLARTSATPGKTRLIIYFGVDGQVLLTDLPGYGHAEVSKACRQAYSSLASLYMDSRRRIMLVLHLMDIRHPPSSHDMMMLAWLNHHKLPFQIILTKSDKMSRTEIIQARQTIAAAAGISDPGSLIAFSAKSGLGVDDLRHAVNVVFDRTMPDLH